MRYSSSFSHYKGFPSEAWFVIGVVALLFFSFFIATKKKRNDNVPWFIVLTVLVLIAIAITARNYF